MTPIHPVRWLDISQRVCRLKTVLFIFILAILSTANGASVGGDSQREASSPAAHDKRFWKAIIANDLSVPEGFTQTELAEELKKYIQSPDSEWRDDIAATIFTGWIAQKQTLPPDEVLSLSSEWTAQLHSRDFAPSDSTVGRTFSALMLAAVIYRDNQNPILDEAQYRRILRSGLDYLADEKDLRGYDERLGWIHATAHTADLLKFAARSRYFTQQDQSAVLDAIRNRMLSANGMFVRGEDERLARAVLSILNRRDFDAGGFHQWTQKLKTNLAFPKEVTIKALDRRQNVINLCTKLQVIAATQPNDAAGAQFASQELLRILENAF